MIGEITKENLPSKDVLEIIGKISDPDVYAVGGYVRDYFLGLPSDDIDIVVVGNGPEVAQQFADFTRSRVDIFKTYGTAKVNYKNLEIEFVGARKESYAPDSRNPSVTPGTLEEDLTRRDFTINALAINLKTWELVDLFGGTEDLRKGIIRTPTDPRKTFSDDPLRMLRCIRFSGRFNFTIEERTLKAIRSCSSRIKIITMERISTELGKIMEGPNPGRGFSLLEQTGLLKYIIPELSSLNEIPSVGHHKNNFHHSIQVLQNVAEKSKSVWLRWAALLHDIGKSVEKSYDPEKGWSFHNHEFTGALMIRPIFERLRLPLGKTEEFVERMVRLHMRPSLISAEQITDSAVRKLLHDSDPYIDELMLLCSCDYTTRSEEKQAKIRGHFNDLVNLIEDFKVRDYRRLFQPSLNGYDIMEYCGIGKGALVGILKESAKNAILDGTLENTPDSIKKYLDEIYDRENHCLRENKEEGR